MSRVSGQLTTQGEATAAVPYFGAVHVELRGQFKGSVRVQSRTVCEQVSPRVGHPAEARAEPVFVARVTPWEDIGMPGRPIQQSGPGELGPIPAYRDPAVQRELRLLMADLSSGSAGYTITVAGI